MIIEAKAICKSFGKLQVLKGVDLQVNAGEVAAIVGASGAGKTTLLQIIGTLERADSGYLSIDGKDVLRMNQKEQSDFRNRRLGFVFQFHQLLPEFSALENVMMPALIARRNHSEAAAEAKELLAMLNLSERAEHKPSELSGGEKQRVAVARALINKPAVILADEPSGSLDSKHKEELHELIFKLRQEMGQSFVIVTHDDALAERCDRKWQIVDGLIVNS